MISLRYNWSSAQSALFALICLVLSTWIFSYSMHTLYVHYKFLVVNFGFSLTTIFTLVIISLYIFMCYYYSTFLFPKAEVNIEYGIPTLIITLLGAS